MNQLRQPNLRQNQLLARYVVAALLYPQISQNNQQPVQQQNSAGHNLIGIAVPVGKVLCHPTQGVNSAVVACPKCMTSYLSDKKRSNLIQLEIDSFVESVNQFDVSRKCTLTLCRRPEPVDSKKIAIVLILVLCYRFTASSSGTNHWKR